MSWSKIYEAFKEDPLSVGLAGLGFIEGLYKYYVQPEVEAKMRAGIYLARAILGHETPNP